MPKIDEIKVKKGSIHYLKAVVFSLMSFLSLRKDVIRSKIQKREATSKDLESALKLYSDIAKSWLFKSIKLPIISMITD